MTFHCPIILQDCCERTESLTGDLAEVGVWRGDSAEWILRHTTHGQLYLYDTFCGMPEEMTRPDDYHRPGTWSDTSYEFVRDKLKKYGSRVVIRGGVFPLTAVVNQDEGPFRLVHIDCDQYLSTRAAIEWFASRMVPGGLIVSDDYGCSSTSAKKAIDEWLATHGDAWSLEKRGTRGIISQVLTEAIV